MVRSFSNLRKRRRIEPYREKKSIPSAVDKLYQVQDVQKIMATVDSAMNEPGTKRYLASLLRKIPTADRSEAFSYCFVRAVLAMTKYREIKGKTVNEYLNPVWRYAILTFIHDKKKKERREIEFFRKMQTSIQETKRPEETEGYEREIKQMRAIIPRLPSRQREILRLFYIEGMSMTEISKIMEVNKATISREIKRALNLFRAEMGLSE